MTASRSLDELRRYENNVRGGGFDLFDTIEHLNHFTFGCSGRNLRDAVKIACENKEHVDQVISILRNVAYLVQCDIVTTSSSMTPSGLSQNSFKEYGQRLELFRETGLAASEVEDEELAKIIEETKTEVANAHAITKDLQQWSSLKPNVISFFTKISPVPSPSVILASHFARDDGVISAVSFDKASNDKTLQQEVIQKLVEKILLHASSKQIDGESIDELLSLPDLPNIAEHHTLQFFDKIFENFESIYTSKDDLSKFTKMLRKFFEILPFESKDLVASKLINIYSQSSFNCLPNLQNYCGDKYTEELTKAINSIGDSNDMQKNPEKFAKIRNELLWFLLVTPKNTVRRLLECCLNNIDYMPAVFRILWGLPSLFRASVLITGICENEAERVLPSILRTIFYDDQHRWQSGDQLKNFCQIAMSLLKPKPKTMKKKDDDDEESLLDPTDLIIWVVMPICFKYSTDERYVIASTELFKRIFSTKQQLEFKFCTKMGDKTFKETESLPIIDLFMLICDILMSHGGLSDTVVENCKVILKLVGQRLSDQEIVFEGDTQKNILGLLNVYEWWFKYAICTYFRVSLGSPKLQIPCGLYNALPDDEQLQFEKIVTDSPSSTVECYFRSVFELGLYDSKLALTQIRMGMDKRVNDDNIVEKMALALVDTCKLPFTRKCVVDIADLLKGMIEIIDPTRKIMHLESWSEAMFVAFRNIDHLLLLGKAVRLSFEKKLASFGSDTEDQTVLSANRPLSDTEVFEKLVDSFCEATKAYFDSELKELKEMRHRLKGLERSSSSDRFEERRKIEKREAAMLIELIHLFKDACCISRFFRTVPSKLQVLLSSLVEQDFDIRKSMLHNELDSIIMETVKVPVVYAYAQNSECESTKPTAVAAVVHRSDTDGVQQTEPRSEDHSTTAVQNEIYASNPLFDRNNSSRQFKPYPQRSRRDSNNSHPDSEPPRRTSFRDPQTLNPRERHNYYQSLRPRNNDHRNERRGDNRPSNYQEHRRGQNDNPHYNDRNNRRDDNSYRNDSGSYRHEDSKPHDYDDRYDRGNRRNNAYSDDRDNRRFDDRDRYNDYPNDYSSNRRNDDYWRDERGRRNSGNWENSQPNRNRSDNYSDDHYSAADNGYHDRLRDFNSDFDNMHRKFENFQKDWPDSHRRYNSSSSEMSGALSQIPHNSTKNQIERKIANNNQQPRPSSRDYGGPNNDYDRRNDGGRRGDDVDSRYSNRSHNETNTSHHGSEKGSGTKKKQRNKFKR